MLKFLDNVDFLIAILSHRWISLDGCMVRFRSTDLINSIVSILDGPGTGWSICIFLEYRQVRLIFEFKMAHLNA